MTLPGLRVDFQRSSKRLAGDGHRRVRWNVTLAAVVCSGELLKIAGALERRSVSLHDWAKPCRQSVYYCHVCSPIVNLETAELDGDPLLPPHLVTIGWFDPEDFLRQ